MRLPDEYREPLIVAARWALLAAVVGTEAAVLSVWLALVTSAPPLSRPAVVAVVVLAAGLLVAHFLVDLAVNGPAVGFPLGGTLAVSVTETALWTGWIGVVTYLGGLRGAFVGGVAFAVALAVQHTIETNVLRSGPLTDPLVNVQTVGYSLVTAAGATVWLTLSAGLDGSEGISALAADAGLVPETVGFVALVAALLFEHAIVIWVARRERAETTMPQWRDYRSWM